MSAKSNFYYEFHKFRLNTTDTTLWRNGERLHLHPKVGELLLLLVEKKGEVLTRDEILEKVWPDAFVEEANINVNISILRKVLRNNGTKTDKFIETVPKKGYRFVAEIDKIYLEENKTPGKVENQTKEPVTEKQPQGSSIQKPLPLWHMVGVIVLVLFVLSAIYFLVFDAFYDADNASTFAGTSKINSIAVLPLRTYGNDQEDEPLGIRITDALITKLGTLQQLSVRPTNSVISFDNEDRNITNIGKKLGVDAVLDGAVQMEGDRLRVSLQLISVRDNIQIWSKQFDGERGKLLTLQDRIGDSLRKKFEIASNIKFQRRPTSNDDAYEAYLKGRYYWNKRTGKGLKESIKLYKLAIDLDPTFALGYAGLADSYVLLNDYNLTPPSENFPKAKSAALKGLEIEPDLVEPRNTLAYILATYEWKYEEAEKEYRRVLEMAPNYATARQWYGEMLYTIKRFDEADAQLKKALEFDPLVPIIRSELAVVQYYRRNYGQAIKQFAELKDEFPTFPTTYIFTARSFEQKQMPDASFINEIRYWELTGIDREEIQILKEAFKAGGRPAYLSQLTDQLEAEAREKYVYEYRLAHAYARRRDRRKTLEWLERGIEHRSSGIVKAYIDPSFDFLRNDKAFQNLIKKMNFPKKK